MEGWAEWPYPTFEGRLPPDQPLPHTRSPAGPCPGLSLVAPEAPRAPPWGLASLSASLECEPWDAGSEIGAVSPD